MIYILLILIIVLIIVLHKKLKNYIEHMFVQQHNEILVEILHKTEDIYRDMEKRGLDEEDLGPAPEFKE